MLPSTPAKLAVFTCDFSIHSCRQSQRQIISSFSFLVVNQTIIDFSLTQTFFSSFETERFSLTLFQRFVFEPLKIGSSDWFGDCGFHCWVFNFSLSSNPAKLAAFTFGFHFILAVNPSDKSFPLFHSSL